MRKPLPKLKSRKAFEEFIDKENLGDYLEPKDLSKIPFHFKNQDRVISLRVSSELLKLLKKAAIKHHIKYQRLIKSILEKNIGGYL